VVPRSSILAAGDRRLERRVALDLLDEFKVDLHHERHWLLRDIVATLRDEFVDVSFAVRQERSHMRPDGGILSVVDRDGHQHPILIVEG